MEHGKTRKVILSDVGVSLAEYSGEINTTTQAVLNAQTK
jgi:hypothetical protein